MEFSDKSLIFLISQPRAGSTLLQKILGAHAEIHTLQEPWIMLHPFYALKPGKYQSEYNAQWASEALSLFLEALPHGEDDYFEGVRRMYTYLYNCALSSSGKTFFLDKTPRYYSIIPELFRTFPSAHFIVIIRNPLAVLCSVLDYFTKGDLNLLHLYREDLLSAPASIKNGVKLLGPQCIRVTYEGLIGNPESEVSRICSKLGISFTPDMINYGSSPGVKWKFGDKKSVQKKERPDPKHIDKWISALSDPQTWQLVYDYLEYLGDEALQDMGYDPGTLRDTVLQNRHGSIWPFKKRGLLDLLKKA